MNRIANGWRMAGQSYAVLRSNRSLAAFPVVSAVLTTGAFAVLAVPGVLLAFEADDWYLAIPFALVGAYVATYVALYFNVALAAAVAASLEGREARMGDGFAVARQRRGLIARWALVSVVVGAVLNALQLAVDDRNPLVRIVAGIVVGLAGAAWAVATFLVVPVLAFEGLGPKAALKRSAELVRARWGEGATGGAAIGGAVVLIALVPAAALIAVGIAVEGAAAIAAFAAATLVVIVALVLGTALGAIFRVVLYRFAAGGLSTPGFDDLALAASFAPGGARPVVT